MTLKDLDHRAQEAFLEAAHYIARADRLITAEEKERLAFYRRETGISEEEYPADGSGNKLDEAMAVLRLLTMEQRQFVFDELEGLAMCDSDYNSSEQIVVNAIRDMLHID